MKRILLTLVLLVSVASAQTWAFDRSHSSVNFAVDHLVVSETAGKFKDFNVTLGGSKEDLSDLTINAVIQVNSIDTEDPKRDGHLKSPDFFDAAKYPTITFVSTGVKKTGNNTYDIAGNLTMHGVTKPVVLKTVAKGPVKSPYGKTVIGFKGETVVNRKDYGVTWNANLDNGGLAVGNEVRVTINAEILK